jgi:O-antigen ligase
VRSLLGFVILAALPVYVIVVMQSRDSELGCCIAAAIIFGFRLAKVDWRKQQMSAAVFFLLAPVIYLGFYFAGIDLFAEAEDAFDRVTMVNDQFRGVDSGGSGRADIWKAAIDRILEAPVFGHGFKGQDRVLPDNLVAHNAYLGILVETGVVGLLSYLIMVYTGLYYLFKRGRSLDAFPQRLAVYISFLIYGLVESRAFGFGNTYTLLFLMIAFDSSKRPVVNPITARADIAPRPAGLSPVAARGALTAR